MMTLKKIAMDEEMNGFLVKKDLIYKEQDDKIAFFNQKKN